jgi:phosphatidylglycerophosphate synthase
MDGRKLTEDQENPIDNIIIHFAIRVNPYLHSIGVTANMLTMGSFIFGLAAVALIHINQFELAALTFAIAYTFDCMDGNMARMFNKVSDFGDKLDHYTDLIQFVLLVIFIAINRTLSYRFKVLFFCAMIILLGFTAVHIGCQEKHYDENSDDFLSAFKILCPNKEMVHYTRYLGFGTFNLKVVIMFLFARYI